MLKTRFILENTWTNISIHCWKRVSFVSPREGCLSFGKKKFRHFLVDSFSNSSVHILILEDLLRQHMALCWLPTLNPCYSLVLRCTILSQERYQYFKSWKIQICTTSQSVRSLQRKWVVFMSIHSFELSFPCTHPPSGFAYYYIYVSTLSRGLFPFPST